jgi:hypothetical protein
MFSKSKRRLKRECRNWSSSTKKSFCSMRKQSETRLPKKMSASNDSIWSLKDWGNASLLIDFLFRLYYPSLPLLTVRHYLNTLPITLSNNNIIFPHLFPHWLASLWQWFDCLFPTYLVDKLLSCHVWCDSFFPILIFAFSWLLIAQIHISAIGSNFDCIICSISVKLKDERCCKLGVRLAI